MNAHNHVDRYEIEIGDENLNFTRHVIDDPKPAGRQLIRNAGVHPVEDYVALAMLPDGRLEDVGLDELFDLRGQGAERVVVLKADATYRFIVDGEEKVWKTVVSGRVLKILAGVDPVRHDVYQDIRGGDDLLIRDTDLVDLTRPGVERFFTAVSQTTEGLSALLPPRDVAYLDNRGIAHDDLVEGGQRGIVLRDFPLPAGKFDANRADFLLLLPPGYPDCPVDMWYAFPWLRLAGTGVDPRQTSVPLQAAGRTWQRWSRHNYEWRPGTDGVHTMVKRIERALAEAA
ncbi:multiubiquitin domain-containing protein [Methylobacterium sp. J-092]|uniref:multiubiquitin domain-containing protein n=1 Tax=Methylobacterium sp. J-092 TaxID=2836667 RepID=UPI001FB864A8|nr:multiubiquitin domain-containing protein [Methylobacterium sp. J-092]MCJ2007050.1 multiubiquitin domain-containing protein [Methylobacterium sp. J-092]